MVGGSLTGVYQIYSAQLCLDGALFSFAVAGPVASRRPCRCIGPKFSSTTPQSANFSNNPIDYSPTTATTTTIEANFKCQITCKPPSSIELKR